MLLMMASLLIVSLLIFERYPGGMGISKDDTLGGEQQMAPQQKAAAVNQLIQDAASLQKQQLEQQIQQ
ncbi:MAG: hypothetical protein GY815_18180 [Gammaproteobacteria bacterium]|nr:hypothetical protein [Gammaproteobacteria bacterium]